MVTLTIGSEAVWTNAFLVAPLSHLSNVICATPSVYWFDAVPPGTLNVSRHDRVSDVLKDPKRPCIRIALPLMRMDLSRWDVPKGGHTDGQKEGRSRSKVMPDARILRRPPNQTVLVINSGGLVIPTSGSLERRPILLHDNGHTLMIRWSV